MKIEILDSTLRDGAQGQGVSFSLEDKINIISALDKLGVSVIEAGNPGSNPKDAELFEKISRVKLKNARVAAFSSTRRKGIKACDDKNLKAILDSKVKTSVIFGKSWDLHVKSVLKTTPEENLKMIYDSIAYIKSKGLEVIFDAEHFFDGYKSNAEYAVKTLNAAASAGADTIVLCDTNGSAFPDEVGEVTKLIKEKFDMTVGIHCHNDVGMGVASSIEAVYAGATQVHGTMIGCGERCGNANLSTIIPNLQIKRGFLCVPEENMAQLTRTAKQIAEIMNVSLKNDMPYVGDSAFAHKAGMHADGVYKLPISFEHIDPGIVGNERHFPISEMAGRASIVHKIYKFAPDLNKDSKETVEIIEKLKEMERRGFEYEGAEGSFELLVRRHIGKYKKFFELDHFRIIGGQPTSSENSASALMKIIVDGKDEITAAEGMGPVHALDCAMRKALEVFYPALKEVRLIDYKVRVLNPKGATATSVRVLITSTDGESIWTTVGVSRDIIEASWIALVDSMEYKLIHDMERKN